MITTIVMIYVYLFMFILCDTGWGFTSLANLVQITIL